MDTVKPPGLTELCTPNQPSHKIHSGELVIKLSRSMPHKQSQNLHVYKSEIFILTGQPLLSQQYNWLKKEILESGNVNNWCDYVLLVLPLNQLVVLVSYSHNIYCTNNKKDQSSLPKKKKIIIIRLPVSFSPQLASQGHSDWCAFHPPFGIPPTEFKTYNHKC